MAALASDLECPPSCLAYNAIPDVDLRITCLQQMSTGYKNIADSMKDSVPKQADKYLSMYEEIDAYVVRLQAAQAAQALAAPIIPLYDPSEEMVQLCGGNDPSLGEGEGEGDDNKQGETKQDNSMAIFQRILDRNPHKQKLLEMSVDICEKCLSYSSPAYSTTVFGGANNGNGENQRVPLLQHWMHALDADHHPNTFLSGPSLKDLKGKDLFIHATTLHGAHAWKSTVTSEYMRQQFVALLDEVCDPSNGPWDEVKTAVFLVACCISSVKARAIYQGRSQDDPLKAVHDINVARLEQELKELTAKYETDEQEWEEWNENGNGEADESSMPVRRLSIDAYAKAMQSNREQLFAYKNEFAATLGARNGSAMNFVQTQAVVEKHMNTICSSLLQIEAGMRASGEYLTLAALELASAPTPPTPTPLRQDHDNFLGRHPTYMTFKELFELPPSHFPGCEGMTMNGKPDGPKRIRKNHLYFWGKVNSHNVLLHSLDDDMKNMLSFHLATMGDAVKNFDINPTMAKNAAKIRFEQRLAYQPFILWLLNVSRRFSSTFHDKMRAILPSETEYTENTTASSSFGDVTIPSASCYHEASLKGLQRCVEKVNDDYHFLDGNAMPTGARLLDVVRGLVVSPSVDHLVKCYERICASFTVLRVKNGFADDETPQFGFRQILMNVACPGGVGTEEEGTAMVVEVQLNLASYVAVKHTIHRFYSVLRCTNEEELDGVVTKKTSAF
jgi:hypothetical protein